MNWIKTPELLQRNRLIFAHYESVKGTCRNPIVKTAQDLNLSYTLVKEATISERLRIGREIEAIMQELTATKKAA